MTNAIGTITQIYQPITTPKGTPIQEISLLKNDQTTIYLQAHRHLDILNDIEVNDEVLVSYETFGKEIKKEASIIHFNTLVIKKINKL